ncbi:tetratricopeptide repeat protein, partial [Thermodesulfobacteriota bacterium]
MNPFNIIRSYFISLKASRLQGRGEFEKVIALSNKAREYNPKSMLALGQLADDLIRLGRLDEAKEILAEAIAYYPKDHQFNIKYAELLQKTGSPLEVFVPYIHTYLENRPSSVTKSPFMMKALFNLFGKSERFEDMLESIDIHILATDRWATYYANEFKNKNADKSIIVISITKEGEIWIEGEKVELNTVKSRIEDLKNKFPAGKIIIGKDKDSPSEIVTEVSNL